MNNKFLLPNRFKQIGLFISPIGLLLWVLLQRQLLFADAAHLLKVLLLIVTSSSFILGFFFAVFSKEKIEDEFIGQKRLETLLISSLVQVILVVSGFFAIGFLQWPLTHEDAMFYFIGCIFLFYLFYLIRFNYVIRLRFKLQ